MFNALGVFRATYDMVSHARQVPYSPTANQHNGVLCQVVPLTRNVRSDFGVV